MKTATTSKLKLISSMFIFGTIGIFINYIPLPSGFIAFFRGIIGAGVIGAYIFFSKKKSDKTSIKKNLALLLVSGGAIGFNWIFLFEAYRHTTVATATLCYYMAPVFVILISPIFLREKLTVKKILCAVTALLGMCFISGVVGGVIPSKDQFLGIVFGLCAAGLYASVMIMNKKIMGVAAQDKTFLQLFAAGIVVLPYTLLAENPTFNGTTPTTLVLLMTVCVVHTGLAYLLYFGSFEGVSASTAAIMSYIDPLVAIILSAVILTQPMNALSILGAILILSGALISETDFTLKNNKNP